MRKKLFIILQFHILILLFQLMFRQLFLDTTFVRDIGIFIMCAIYFTGRNEPSPKLGTIGTMVKIYLWYGIIMSFVHIIDEMPVVETVVIYRNHFFPFILFFITYYIMRDERYRKKWVNLLFVIFIIIVTDVYFEMILRAIGVSRSGLPWYSYQIAHYYRFTGDDPDAVQLARNLDSTPILGLLGWNNLTSCAIVALVSFLIPFLMNPSISEKDSPIVLRLSKMKRMLLIVLTIGAMVILEVKTPFVSLVIVVFMYTLFEGKRAFKQLFAITAITALVAVFTIDYWGEIYAEQMEETVDSGELAYIFDSKVIGYLLSAAFNDSPLALLFGTDITKNHMFELLEVRVVVHTMQFGIIWLIIYGIMMFSTVGVYKKTRRIDISSFDQILATGSFLLIISYLVDFLHYAHAMFLFHIDILVVSMAIIVAVYKSKQIRVYNES